MAFAEYAILDNSDAAVVVVVEVVADDDDFPPIDDSPDAVLARPRTFCCIKNGILAERPMGIPCNVYSAISNA
jgi:hypothetical protein